MIYRPPFWLPTNSEEPIQFPPAYRVRIDWTFWLGNTDIVPASDALIDKWRPNIENFVQLQRFQRDVGIIEIVRRRVGFPDKFPEVIAEYRSEQGREYVEIVTYPTNIPPGDIPHPPVNFVAIDTGNYATADPNYNNYPGGFNVMVSPDGRNWGFAARLGVVTDDPLNNQSIGLTPVPNHYYWTVTVNAVGGWWWGAVNPPEFEVDIGPVGGPVGGVVYDPRAVPHTIINSYTTTTTSDATGPGGTFQQWGPKFGVTGAGTPNQAIYDYLGITMETDIRGAQVTQQDGAQITALNGFAEYIVFGDDRVSVGGVLTGFGPTYVIAGYAQTSSPHVIPLYWRSTDGKKWTQFILPWTQPTNWTPETDDVWFDDGSQRTMTNDTHGNPHFDGTPTLKWFSSDASGITGHLYESSDGCQTWSVSSLIYGLNSSTGKTDNTHIGFPPWQYGENGTMSTGLWSTAYGYLELANGGSGARMGVKIQGASDQFHVLCGDATVAPSSWANILLPIPQADTDEMSFAEAQDNAHVTQTINNLEAQKIPLNNAIGEATAYGNWDTSNPPPAGTQWYPLMDAGGAASIISSANADIAAIDAEIAAITPPPPRSRSASPSYVAYNPMIVNGKKGIFVLMGSTFLTNVWAPSGLYTIETPVYWWTQDCVNWFASNETPLSGINSFEDPAWTIGDIGIVAGVNVVDQLFPVAPT